MAVAVYFEKLGDRAKAREAAVNVYPNKVVSFGNGKEIRGLDLSLEQLEEVVAQNIPFGEWKDGQFCRVDIDELRQRLTNK